MSTRLLEKFEAALRQRNPQLTERLQPGIPEARIRRMLERAGARGALAPIVSLFSWKNGTNNFCNELSKEQASPFPTRRHARKTLKNSRKSTLKIHELRRNILLIANVLERFPKNSFRR